MDFAVGGKKSKENREKLREIRDAAAEILRNRNTPNVVTEEAEKIQSLVVDLLVEN
jgi:hypothetical protein